MINFDQLNTAQTPPANSDEIDLGQLFDTLRRNWKWLLLTPLLAGAAAYFWFAQQPPVFQSTAKLMAAPLDANNKLLTNTGGNASQLPQGAVAEIARSPSVIRELQQTVANASLPADLKSKIIASLKQEVSTGQFSRVNVRAKVDVSGRGVYEITTKAETPDAARVLANGTANAIRNWDTERLKAGITQARKNLLEQINNIDSRLSTAATEGERQSLMAAKGQMLLDLSQATVMEQAIQGSLSLLSEANTPSQPFAPKPLRNAVLAALVSLLLTSGLIVIIDQFQRKIRSARDLGNLGFRVLGEFPRVAYIERNQTIASARSGDLYEPAGFTRVNLDATLDAVHMEQHGMIRPSLITVTSAKPTEGKSSVVAALAIAYALANKRVLLIDMDMHRPKQQGMWPLETATPVLLPGSLEARTSSISEALENPDYAAAYRVADNVDLIPSKVEGRRASALLNTPHFGALLERWSQEYDAVIIDSPPVLALSDAFSIARHTDGLIMVVESEKTSQQELQRVIQDINTNHIRVLGAVLNKVSQSARGYYSYKYSGGYGDYKDAPRERNVRA